MYMGSSIKDVSSLAPALPEEGEASLRNGGERLMGLAQCIFQRMWKLEKLEILEMKWRRFSCLHFITNQL